MGQGMGAQRTDVCKPVVEAFDLAAWPASDRDTYQLQLGRQCLRRAPLAWHQIVIILICSSFLSMHLMLFFVQLAKPLLPNVWRLEHAVKIVLCLYDMGSLCMFTTLILSPRPLSVKKTLVLAQLHPKRLHGDALWAKATLRNVRGKGTHMSSSQSVKETVAATDAAVTAPPSVQAAQQAISKAQHAWEAVKVAVEVVVERHVAAPKVASETGGRHVGG